MEIERLQQCYLLEKERYQLETEYMETELCYRQAQYDRRESQNKFRGYEGYSLAAVRDRIRGCYEQQVEQYRQEARNAEAALLHARQELERIQQKQKKNAQQRELLPAWEAVRDWIGEDTAGLQEWGRLETELCQFLLIPLLEKTREALLESQQVFRGDTLGRVMTFEEQQKALAAPNELALECARLLERMQKAAQGLDISVEIPAYFQNPVGYLAAATKFTRFDRYTEALSQTERLIREYPIK